MKRTIELMTPEQFEPEEHFYPKALNSQLHAMVSHFFNLDHKQIIDLLHAHPTLIKRPVLIKEGDVTVGFNNTQYSTLFSTKE